MDDGISFLNVREQVVIERCSGLGYAHVKIWVESLVLLTDRAGSYT